MAEAETPGLTNDPARQHDWKRDEDGEIDIWQVDLGHHNGPRCARCGEGFCHHCHEDCYLYVCPEASS